MSKFEGYSVEYFTASGWYKARKGEKYLATSLDTGLIRPLDLASVELELSCSDRFHTEEGAWMLISKYIAQPSKPESIIFTK